MCVSYFFTNWCRTLVSNKRESSINIKKPACAVEGRQLPRSSQLGRPKEWWRNSHPYCEYERCPSLFNTVPPFHSPSHLNIQAVKERWLFLLNMQAVRTYLMLVFMNLTYHIYQSGLEVLFYHSFPSLESSLTKVFICSCFFFSLILLEGRDFSIRRGWRLSQV